MRAVAMAKDVAFRRGHLPTRDDARQGRVALICCHCGARASWERGDLRGLLLAEGGRCIGFEPKSRRQREIEEMDREDGWTGRTAIEEALWAVHASRVMSYRLHGPDIRSDDRFPDPSRAMVRYSLGLPDSGDSLPRGGRGGSGRGR